jgi:hypothetical protein
MGIKFDPPLGATSTLALPPTYSPDTDVDITFRATFDTPAEAAQVRADGIRIEMWTNVPAPGRAAGEWGALAFVPERVPPKQDASFANGGARTFAISPDAPLSARFSASEADTYRIRLRTRFPAGESRYGYTFRCVDPDGGIRWLGDYSRDGQFIVERRDSRIEFAPDAVWKTTESGESTWAGESETVVGTLNTALEWSVWALGQDGYVFSRAYISPTW